MTKIAVSGFNPGSGSISQRLGSPDPDPLQNFMDPQHCLSIDEFFASCRAAEMGGGGSPLYGAVDF